MGGEPWKVGEQTLSTTAPPPLSLKAGCAACARDETDSGGGDAGGQHAALSSVCLEKEKSARHVGGSTNWLPD